MRRVSCVPSVIALLLAAEGSAIGATFHCPTVGPPYPGPEVVLEMWADKKGGMWTLTCTNSSATGDFVWKYKAPGAAAPKPRPIGACVFPQGRNTTWETTDPATGNVKTWYHICFDPKKQPDGSFRAILDVFDKDACKGTRRYFRYDQRAPEPCWEEVSPRRDTSPSQYETEGFADLFTDIYGDDIPEIIADWETRITFDASFTPGPDTHAIFWNVGNLEPTYASGDKVAFSGLTLSNIVGVAPGWAVNQTTDGIELTATMSHVISPAEHLVTVGNTGPTLFPSRYSVSQQGTADYWDAIFDDPRPLHEIGFSCDPLFRDMPGYGNTYGNIMLPTPGAGAVLFAAGVLCLRRRP